MQLAKRVLQDDAREALLEQMAVIYPRSLDEVSTCRRMCVYKSWRTDNTPVRAYTGTRTRTHAHTHTLSLPPHTPTYDRTCIRACACMHESVSVCVFYASVLVPVLVPVTHRSNLPCSHARASSTNGPWVGWCMSRRRLPKTGCASSARRKCWGLSLKSLSAPSWAEFLLQVSRVHRTQSMPTPAFLLAPLPALGHSCIPRAHTPRNVCARARTHMHYCA